MKFISGAEGLLPLLIGAFVASALIALSLTPLVRTLVGRRGIVDAPNHRRVNTSPVPRGGGIAVVIAFLIVGGGLTLFRRDLGVMPLPIGIPPGQLVALFGGGALAAMIGAADDIFDLRARWQFIGQIVLAVVAVLLGISVVVISNPFGPTLVFATPFAIAFTLVWIIGMLNSMNFID
ncbi:MAG: undecaprenyl/decaprenyl-phosphate alpha-N-acetylglucosaminyl 1-phosphate transferase, partial [Chloroflexota bacterium]